MRKKLGVRHALESDDEAPGSSAAARLHAALPALLVPILFALGCSSAPEPKAPNVLLIVLDTVRADVLSTYGYPKPTAPNIDRLAREGALMSQAISTDFWTLPSHASMLTGQYPSRHGATSESGRLDAGLSSLAEILRAAGFRTGGFVTNAWLSKERGFGQGFDEYVESWKMPATNPSTLAIDRHGVRNAIEWMAAPNALDAPFFAFVNLNSAHMPYNPGSEALITLSPKPRSIEGSRRLRKLTGMWEHLGGTLELNEVDYEILRELYEAEVLQVDALVGELVGALEAAGRLDDTLIIVTADHGENLGDHGSIDHLFSMYDSTLHIPMVLRHPTSFEAGRVDTALASPIDLLPTILSVAGVPLPDIEIDGVDLSQPERTARRFVVAENERPLNAIDLMGKSFPDFDTSKLDGRKRALRTSEHKLIWQEGGPVELYDLSADPNELDDLSEREVELRTRLEGQLEVWMKEMGNPGAVKPFESQDTQSIDELRALGYIE